MRLPFDGAERRRVYLLRHARAAYRGADGRPAADPRRVGLTPEGRREAEAMRGLLAPIAFDRAVCSGLPRTLETARIVLGERDLPLEELPDLEEVRSGPRPPGGVRDLRELAPRLAYSLWTAREPMGSFLGGETYTGLRERAAVGLQKLLDARDWTRLLLVAHGAINRALLAWALDVEAPLLPGLEQDSCCLNILDFDRDPADGRPVRAIVRLLNLTPGDWIKEGQWLTTLEAQALELLE